MRKLPEKLLQKLNQRVSEQSLRTLKAPVDLIDFASNDYLGYSRSKTISRRAAEILEEYDLHPNGSTGSRLLTGNSVLFEQLESIAAVHHKADAALVFNSGFDANLGLLSAIPQRGDLIIFDELVHASIREGVRLSMADSLKFRHNDLEDLERILKARSKNDIVYVVTESVFSMDGDSPDLHEICRLCSKFGARLIIDEAHAIGLSERGLIVDNGLEDQVFARLVTFGKALGCHGASVLGDDQLIAYLVNFARSFIYTTALPPHSVATVMAAYEHLNSAKGNMEVEKLRSNITSMRSLIEEAGLSHRFIESESAVQAFLVNGNERARSLSRALSDNNLDVRPILSPTVPKGQERLRICLHSFNNIREIKRLISQLEEFNG